MDKEGEVEGNLEADKEGEGEGEFKLDKQDFKFK